MCALSSFIRSSASTPTLPESRHSLGLTSTIKFMVMVLLSYRIPWMISRAPSKQFFSLACWIHSCFVSLDNIELLCTCTQCAAFCTSVYFTLYPFVCTHNLYRLVNPCHLLFLPHKIGFPTAWICKLLKIPTPNKGNCMFYFGYSVLLINLVCGGKKTKLTSRLSLIG